MFILPFMFASLKSVPSRHPSYQLSWVANQITVTHHQADGNESVAVVPVGVPTKNPTVVMFRHGDRYAVWDERGLTVREGTKASTTNLKAVPTSPRLRTQAEIRKTLAEGHSLGASALSGSAWIQSVAYFLVRWQDGPGRTWLEALVEVDLAKPHPAAEVLTVLPGQSFASHAVDQVLQVRGNDLYACIKEGTSWGRWNYNLGAKSSTFTALGKNPMYVEAGPTGTIVFSEKTGYGSYTAGTVNLLGTTPKVTEESPNPFQFLDGENPAIALTTSDTNQREAVNLETGAVFSIPQGATILRTKLGLLVWQKGQASKAWLLGENQFSPRAWWPKG